MITIRKGTAVSIVPETAFREIFSGQGWAANTIPEAAEEFPEKPKRKRGGKDAADRRAENDTA